VAERDLAELADLLGRPGTRAHFVGIGGAGMAPLAAIVADRGWRVSGCDLAVSDITAQLQARGIPTARGHDPGHVAGQELLVVSSAVPADAPEVAAAERGGVPVVKRARLVGALTRRTRALCVAGTAGKTTTTAMCAVGLLGAGLDPSALVGAAVPGIGVGGRSGRSDLFVVEADEFDRTFLSLRPQVAVVTNVEADHLDYYGSREAIDQAFRQFLALVPADGQVVVCHDDPGARALAPPGALRYGSSPACDWRADGIAPTEDGGTRFAAIGPAGQRLDVQLRLPGRHNALNALAAIAACERVGADPAAVARALGGFEGAARRFERKGEARGVAVYDDYGHHPTKVRATLAAARQRAGRGRVWCVFQPHTYHRTMSLFEDFARAFGDADHVLVLDIYSPAGREQPIAGVDARRLVEAMPHPSARHAASFDEAAGIVAREARDGDLVVTMGAGDVTRLARPLLERLAEEPAGR
jgi:UDP-N-acetylmuramate--alanine ligase